MGYQWNDLKNTILAKMDLTEEEANIQNLINRFPYYANEAITQICSSVKPKYSFVNFVIYNDKQDAWNTCVKKYPDANYNIGHIVEKELPLTSAQTEFWKEYDKIVEDNDFVGVNKTMPNDFISFGDDICYDLQNREIDRFTKATIEIKKELHDSDFSYHGYNQVMFKHRGNFFISYNARWYTLTNNIEGNTYIDVPNDILDCIPSYVASQCFKIDDEYKASVFRNEYEIFLARIDNTNYKNTKTFEIEGDW